MNIACIGYRAWALSIYRSIMLDTEHNFLLIDSKESFEEEKIISFSPDLVLFYGWSWIIPDHLVDRYTCLMLHPSPLPRYRGGSPIQNQIINNESDSAVTIFKIDHGIDTGPICAQQSFSLDGDLNSIFDRITNIGIELTKHIISHGFDLIPQDHNLATFFKRRKPSESEITQEELLTKPASYLHNKIRMLQDPYPNAYIVCADGSKLYLNNSFLR